MEPPVLWSGRKPASDPRKWRTCVVLPTRNEAATLKAVIEEIRAAFQRHELQEPIFLISDDSHDETRAIAAGLGVHVVSGEGKGLGFAMLKGLKTALTFNPDVVVSLDSDGQSDPDEIMRFLEPIASGEVDMVIGSRFQKPGLIAYDYPLINRLGTIILAKILRSITGLPVTDSHGGLRAMRPEVVHSLEIMGTHTYVQESIIDARQKGFVIQEVPSSWRKRESGKSRVVGSIPKYIMYTLPILMIRSGTHVRWLYRASAALVGAALIYFLIVLAQAGFSRARLYPRIPALICIAMLFIIGMQIFTLGFVAEMLRLIKVRLDRLDRD